MAIANNVFFLPLHQHEYVTLYCLKLSVFKVTLFSSCASCQFVCDTLQWSQAYFIFFGKKKALSRDKAFPLLSVFGVGCVCSALQLQVWGCSGYSSLIRQWTEWKCLQSTGWRGRGKWGGQCHLPGAPIVSHLFSCSVLFILTPIQIKADLTQKENLWNM